MNKSFVAIIILFCIGCTNKQKELKYLICKDSIQYWNYEWPRERSEYYGFTFSFDKDGTIKKYSYSKQKQKRSLFTENDAPYASPKNKWSVSEDSILKFLGSKHKIIKYSEDTIYAVDQISKNKIYYVRVKGDLHIENKP